MGPEAAAAPNAETVPGALIDVLARACREHRLREKIVVVPEFRIGRQIGEALAREIGGWLDLRFVTLPVLAQRTAGEALAAAGLTAIGPREALERIRAVMTGLWERAGIPYFSGAWSPGGAAAGFLPGDAGDGDLAGPEKRAQKDVLPRGTAAAAMAPAPSRGLVRAVHRAVQWLRLDGAAAESLNPEAFMVEAKSRDLRLILRRYEERLAAARELDPSGLLAFAARAAAEAGRERLMGEPPLFFRYADHRYFRLEEDFLRAVSPSGVIELCRAPVFGLERPRLYPSPPPSSSARDSTDRSVAPPETLSHAGAAARSVSADSERLPWLFAPEAAPHGPAGHRGDRFARARPSVRPRPAAPDRVEPASDRESEFERAAILCGLIGPPGFEGARHTANRSEGASKPGPAAGSLDEESGHQATTWDPPPTLGIFRAVGAANECREILRRVLASNTPLDDVEIVAPSGSVYPALIHLLALRLGVPATFAGGLPLEFTRPGRALYGFLDWIRTDLADGILRRLLEAGEIEFRDGSAAGGPSGARAAGFIRQARIGWGRERYSARLSASAAEIGARIEALESGRENGGDDEDAAGPDRAENLRRVLADLDSVRRTVASLIDLVLEPDPEGRLDVPALCRGARDFIERFALVEDDLDRSARETVAGRLETLIDGPDAALAPVPSAAAIARLREEAEGLTIADSPPRPGALHVSDWGGGGFAGRPVVFMCGLDAAAFPGAEHQDPILLDREKERLSDGLPTSADLLRERLYDMAALLADLGRAPAAERAPSPGLPDAHLSGTAACAAGSPGALAGVSSGRPKNSAGSSARKPGPGSGAASVDETDGVRLPRRVIFSYSGYDVTGERPAAPSSLVLQAYRLLTGRPGAGYNDLEAALAEETDTLDSEAVSPSPAAAGFIPDSEAKSLDEIDWWLRRIAPDGRARDAAKLLGNTYPALERGLEAQKRRMSLELTEFDGCVRIDPDRHLPAGRPDLRVSSSRLEKLADCPYGYFLSHVIRVRPPEDFEYDPARWLDPRDRGTLIHEILETYMRGGAGKRPRPDGVRDRLRLLEIARARLAEWKEKVPPPSERVYEREAADVLESMDIFLRLEARRPGAAEPLLFEERFDDLIVEVPGHGPLRISGFIDRVDRIGPGRFRVIDYKTGSPRKYEAAERFGKGTVLQYALYALAAEKILKDRGEPGEVVEAGYVFPTRKGDGCEVLIAIDREELAGVLAALMDIVEAGLFVPGRDAHCDFCDYAPACGGAPDRTKAKVPTGRNAEEMAVGEKAGRAVRLLGRLKAYK